MTSRVLGVFRDALFAAVFGVTPLTDAYVVAFRIPNLLRDLFAEGALSSAFVPTFTEALANGGRERAYRIGNLVLSMLLLVTGALTLLGILYSEAIVSMIAPSYRGDQLATAAYLAQIMMPILTLVSVSAAWMGMLNAQQRFLAPAFAPALFNVVSIGVGLSLLASGLDERRAMIAWSAGTTLAAFAQAVVQLPSLWRLGYRPWLVLRGALSSPELRRIARLMGPATIGLAAIQINVFVNTQFATNLGTGPATYLQNAFRLFYLPIGIFGVALATVTTARTSADAVRGDRAALAERVHEGARAVWMLALPSAVGLIVLAEPVVALLFQRGRFGPSDTAATVPIVQAYMLGVLPYSLVKIFSPAFFALDRPRLPMVASMSAVAVNVIFNALTYRQLGAMGLALGTTLAACVNLLILRLAFRRLLGPMPRPGRLRELAALIVANVVMGLVAGGIWYAGKDHGGAVLLFATIGVAFIVYVSVLRALGYPGASELAQLPGKIVARVTSRGGR